jgi:hypothetical protein
MLQTFNSSRQQTIRRQNLARRAEHIPYDVRNDGWFGRYCYCSPFAGGWSDRLTDSKITCAAGGAFFCARVLGNMALFLALFMLRAVA